MNIPEEWGNEPVILTTRILFQLLMNDSRVRFFPSDDYYPKERLYVPREMALLVQAKDPGGRFIHVDLPYSETNPTGDYLLWDARKWVESTERRKNLREYQKKSRASRDLRDTRIREVFREIEKKTGRFIDKQQRKEMVRLAISSVMEKGMVAESVGVKTEEIADNVTREMQFVGDPADYFRDLWED